MPAQPVEGPGLRRRRGHHQEGVLVEAPTLWKHDGKYYLFYSANAYNNPRYAMGYAVSDNLLGPYRKAPQPLLKTDVANSAMKGAA